MEIQPQLVLLQKTLLNIEGIGRQLYPELDLWQTAKPFLERWMQQQVGPRAMFSNLKENMPFLVEKLPEIPLLIYEALKQVTDVRVQERQIKEIKNIRFEIMRARQRTVTAIAGAGLLISAFIVSGLGGYTSTMFLGAPALSWALAGSGGFLLLYSLQD